MHVAIIGGASTIGSTVAYTLASLDPALDISLVDKAPEPAWAHAMDITHSLYHVTNAPVDESTAESYGTVRGIGTDEMGSLNPDVVVLTAAAPRPDDATDRGAREAELEANRSIADDVASQLQSVDPVPVVVLTNPIDRITYRLWKQSGWPREKFIGYSLSETARVAYAIADRKNVHPSRVSCPVMGEHGEGIVPIFSRARIGDDPVSLTDEQQSEILEYVRSVPFEIASRRGASETSRWVTSAGVTRVVRSILSGETTSPGCLSTPLAGEYGFDDGCLSVPVTLDSGGVTAIHEWELADSEHAQLADAFESVRADIGEF
ncbi:malate dehydrogenase [Halostagnicola bangensis]